MKTILCVVMFLAAVGTWALGGFAFAAAPPGGASVLQPYLVTWDHHVGARHGMRQTSAGKTDFINPLLRELAREGHVQNISAMTENSYRLLADGRGAALLTVDGTTLQPTGKSASNDRVTTTLGGTVTAVGGSGISGATVSAFLGSTVLTTTTAAGGTYS